MEISLAWDGYIRHSWWTEARVTLRNEGADWRGDLAIRDTPNQVTYRQTVELPAHSYKQYRLPLFVADGNTPVFTLEDQEKRASIRGLDETQRVVVMADTREPLARAQLSPADTLIWLPTLDSLPETPMAWDVADVLLLNGISTADLTAAQQEALLAWVGAGGHLIVGGGAALQQTLAHLPDALRIAAPGSARQFTQIPLAGATLFTMTAAVLTPNAGATALATVEGNVIAARKGVGKGTVDIIGWDMTQAGSAVWLTGLWAADPIPAVSALTGNQALSSAGPNIYALLEMPFSTLPKFWPWLLLFPLYIFLMGPGTLLLVRRLKKPILAWAFIPAWIFGAVIILALGLSSVFSQMFPLIHEIAIIAVPDAALPARVVQGTAIYAPRVQRLTWNADGAPRPHLGSYRFNTWNNTGDPFPIEARYTDGSTILHTRNPLGIITWGAEGLYDSPAIATNLNITTQDSALYFTGELWSEATLREVSLVMGNAAYGITLTETLPQETAVTVSRPVTATFTVYNYASNLCGQSNESYTPYAIYPGMTMSTNIPETTACYLTGFIDGVPFPANAVGGTHVQESCMIYTIPCPTQPSGRLAVTLDAAMDKIENGWIDAQSNILYAYAQGVTLNYALPVYLRIQDVETLTVTLLPAPEAGATDPLTVITQVSLWNWEKQMWMDYPPAEQIVLTGVTAQQAFAVSDGVRVRLSTQSGVTVKMILTLEGTP